MVLGCDSAGWYVSKVFHFMKSKLIHSYKDHPNFSDAAKDLFLRIVEEASQMDGSAPLFNELMEDTGADIVSFLVKVRRGWGCLSVQYED